MSLKLTEELGHRLVLVNDTLILERCETDSLGGPRWALVDRVHVQHLTGGRDYENDTRIAAMLVNALCERYGVIR